MIRMIAPALTLLSVPAGMVMAQDVPAPQLDPVRLALGRDIVAVVLPPAQRQQIMAGFLNSMVRNMVAGIIDGTPGLKQELAANPRVKAAFDRFVSRQQSLAEADVNKGLPELVEAYAHAYARSFSRDELVQIKAFVSTETGTKFMQRGNALMSDPDVAAWQRRVTEVEAARRRAELATFAGDLKTARTGGKQ